MIDLHRRPGCELRHRVLVEHALWIVRIAQRGVPGQHQDRRSMQARGNQRGRCVSVARTLRGGREADLAGKARIAVRHADGGSLMMGNELEPVLFTQFDNDFLIGIAYDREDAIDALGRNRRSECFQYLHGNLP